MFIPSISICTNSYKRANFFPNYYIWFDSLYPIHDLYWLLNSYLNILNLRKVKYWKCSIYTLLKKTIAKIRLKVFFILILQGCKRKSTVPSKREISMSTDLDQTDKVSTKILRKKCCAIRWFVFASFLTVKRFRKNLKS